VKTEKELSDYLLEKYSPQTVKIYLLDIHRYIGYMGEDRAGNATYRDIMEYTGYLRKMYQNPGTINRMLYGVKAWYFYLIETGQREDHPCRQIKLKDARGGDVQLQDLFSSIEMEKLMQREERFEAAKLRNRVIVSLLIYQGLRLTEITKLRLQDVDLEAGTVFVRAMPRAMARTLKLKTTQVMLFYNYIHEVRPKLLRTGTDRLILTLRGSAENGEGINYLIETFKPLFPERNLSARTLRQSVITNQLKEGKDLRVVQVFAGHKKISSTEKYRQSGLEELQAAIEKYHPLG
jgi:integrase/recombinase XerD